MRSLETVLLGATLVSLMVLSAPRLRAGPWFRISACMALLVAVAQAWLEGPRWQVVPAYALTMVLFAVAMPKHAATASESAWRKGPRQLAASLGTVWLAICSSVSEPRSSGDRMP